MSNSKRVFIMIFVAVGLVYELGKYVNNLPTGKYGKPEGEKISDKQNDEVKPRTYEEIKADEAYLAESSKSVSNDRQIEDYKIADDTGFSTLEKLNKIFVGNPSEEEIEYYMNKALDVYNLERTDENYNKVSNVLLAMSRDSNKGITEMAILKYAIKIHFKNAKITDNMAIAAVFLEQ